MGASYAPIGRAIRDCREKVFLQVHFGAVYDKDGEYGWCRDFETIKKTFLRELEALGTDYVDFGFLTATDEEKDYSVIGSFTADTISGTCVYCNHCQPCPAGIDIGLVNKYYDLALAGDEIAANHYTKLSVNAKACLHCGHCEIRCPFSVKQESRMDEIAEYFS